MRLSLNPLISLLLLIALFAGLQGGRYFLANRLQEVGIFCALLVFALGAYASLFKLDYDSWKRWVYLPILLLGGIMVVSATTFLVQYGGNLLFNFFSAREFLLGFLGPAVFLIVRAGYPIEKLQSVILFCLLLISLNYLYFYNTMDLRAAFFSSNHTVSALVTYDEWRGFRLKPSMVAVMLSILTGMMLIRQFRSLGSVLFAASLIALAVYIWTIVLFRSTLATMLLGLVIYACFLARPGRLHAALLALPIVVIASPFIVSAAGDFFLGADGGSLRMKSFKLALDTLSSHPILGVGEDSVYGVSYQDIFSKTFFPSDIGLIGVAFKYGLVGVGLYLYMHVLIFVKLWKANIRVRKAEGRTDPILFAFLVLLTAQSFNLVLIAGMAYAQGITIASLSLAYACLRDPGEPGREPVRSFRRGVDALSA